jgi:hypothetical protein
MMEPDISSKVTLALDGVLWYITLRGGGADTSERI